MDNDAFWRGFWRGVMHGNVVAACIVALALGVRELAGWVLR